MRRREFLGTSLGAAVSFVGATSCRFETRRLTRARPTLRMSTRDAGTMAERSVTSGGNLGGLTLEELREQYRYDLFDDFLPFMDKYVIDHELGGFMCNTDRDGTNLSTKKNSWYMGRGVWVYSFLYNELTRKKEHLEVARKAVEFLLRDPPKGDNFWPAEYTKEGTPILAKGQYIGGNYIPVSKEVYGDLFIANGFAEYGRAAGDDSYWSMAKNIMFKCIRIYDRSDYAPNAPKVYLGPDAPALAGARLLGVWMLLLRLGSQMLNHKHDAEIEAVVRRCIDAIFNHHYNPEYDLINEVLHHDMSRPANEYAGLVYTGHGIETMWMVLYEAYRQKDSELFHRAARLFRRNLDVAWDDVYGGFFRGVKNVDENTWILDKALWVQEEALIGLLFIVEHTGAQWAKDWFAKAFTYVHEHFPLKEHGYALWDFWPDRNVTFVKHYPRIGNFHHPRHLMLNLLSLERMIQRRGKVSGLFV